MADIKLGDLYLYFRSLKCTVIIRIHRKLSKLPFLSKCQAIQANLQSGDINNHFKQISNVFILYILTQIV